MMKGDRHFLSYFARINIREAHCTRSRNWKFFLLDLAAKTRLEYLHELKAKNNPDHLHNEMEMVADEHGQWSLF
jgi:hypothetical protein